MENESARDILGTGARFVEGRSKALTETLAQRHEHATVARALEAVARLHVELMEGDTSNTDRGIRILPRGQPDLRAAIVRLARDVCPDILRAEDAT